MNQHISIATAVLLYNIKIHRFMHSKHTDQMHYLVMDFHYELLLHSQPVNSVHYLACRKDIHYQNCAWSFVVQLLADVQAHRPETFVLPITNPLW